MVIYINLKSKSKIKNYSQEVYSCQQIPAFLSERAPGKYIGENNFFNNGKGTHKFCKSQMIHNNGVGTKPARYLMVI